MIKTNVWLTGALLAVALPSTAQARYYDPGSARFVSPDPVVEDVDAPQALNRYAYVRNNPLLYTDPLGLWRISLSFHSFFGGHISYDSKSGHFKTGVGLGQGGGAGFGNSDWDIGYSNDNYVDIGYDNRMKSGYVQGQFAGGITGPAGPLHGYGVSGSYYFKQNAFVANGGLGFGGFGINAGYSSFGDGSHSLGASALQANATYDFRAEDWHYAYAVDPQELKRAYAEAKTLRRWNGYGPEGQERRFKIIDMVGTVAAGWEASDRHDDAYRNPYASKTKADLRFLTDMVKGSVSNISSSNGVLRATGGLMLSPLYYGAVAIAGGPAFNGGRKK